MSKTLSRRMLVAWPGLLMVAGMSLGQDSRGGGLRVTTGFRRSRSGSLSTHGDSGRGTSLDGAELDRIVHDIYGRFSLASESSGYPMRLTPENSPPICLENSPRCLGWAFSPSRRAGPRRKRQFLSCR